MQLDGLIQLATLLIILMFAICCLIQIIMVFPTIIIMQEVAIRLLTVVMLMQV